MTLMMLVGQSSATVAWLCLRDNVEPRAVAADAQRVREIQRTLARGVGGPGVLLWPYHDLPPEHPAFEAANLTTVAGPWKADPNSVYFRPDQPVTPEEWLALGQKTPLPRDRAAAVQALGRMMKTICSYHFAPIILPTSFCQLLRGIYE
ncbi:MAG: hypothetical protein ACKV2Q_02225 [Planctomycetaceae bacterium]